MTSGTDDYVYDEATGEWRRRVSAREWKQLCDDADPRQYREAFEYGDEPGASQPFVPNVDNGVSVDWAERVEPKRLARTRETTKEERIMVWLKRREQGGRPDGA